MPGYMIYIDEYVEKMLSALKRDKNETYNEVIKRLLKLSKGERIKIATKRRRKKKKEERGREAIFI